MFLFLPLLSFRDFKLLFYYITCFFYINVGFSMFGAGETRPRTRMEENRMFLKCKLSVCVIPFSSSGEAQQSFLINMGH